MKKAENIKTVMKSLMSKRGLFLVCIVAAFGLAAWLIFGYVESRTDRLINSQISAGDCKDGLNRLRDVSDKDLKYDTKIKLLKYRTECNYELKKYDEALSQSNNLMKVFISGKASDFQIDQLRLLQESIRTSQKNAIIENGIEERIQEDLNNNKRDTYNGPVL